MRIRVFDLETTSIADPPDSAVCEIGWSDVVSPADGEAWSVTAPKALLVNPGRPIPPETSAIHHIVDEDVSGAPGWLEAWNVASAAPDGETIRAFCAHVAKFERKYITDDLTGGADWVCSYKCALRLWPDAPSHSNQSLRYWRKPVGLDRELASLSHRAGPDAYVTAHHLRDMLNGGALLEHMIVRSGQPALQVTCHIGKNNGKKWREVDSGFLEWMLGKDFDEDALYTARFELDRRARENGATGAA